MKSTQVPYGAKLVAMWAARAIGTVLILLAAYLWLATPSSGCDPFRLFGCGLLSLGIGGTIGSAIHWLLICIIATPGVMLWRWKPVRTDDVKRV